MMSGGLNYRRQPGGKVIGVVANPRGLIIASAERTVVNGTIRPP